MESLRGPLALRLAKCIGGLHFQVAERALGLWNCERFAALTLHHAAHRSAILERLFPALHENATGHWHDTIRTLSGTVMDQYAAEDEALLTAMRTAYDNERQLRVASGASASSPEADAALSPTLRSSTPRTSNPAGQGSPPLSESLPRAPAVRGSLTLTNPDGLPRVRAGEGATPKRASLKSMTLLGGGIGAGDDDA